MYKKKQFSSLSKKYSSYQDTGSVGMMMEICHKNLEENKLVQSLSKNSIILEIGAGSSPHLKYLQHSYKKYFFFREFNFFNKSS